MAKPAPQPIESERQRLDKWLWFARVVRTRPMAQALVESGHVRINGERVTLPAKPLRRGDVLTLALDSRVRVLKVVAFAERRRGAPEAQALYEAIGDAG
jgi:ribosome-associated heat shock protein Hsp15